MDYLKRNSFRNYSTSEAKSSKDFTCIVGNLTCLSSKTFMNKFATTGDA